MGRVRYRNETEIEKGTEKQGKRDWERERD